MEDIGNSLSVDPETLTIAKGDKVVCDYIGNIVANNAAIQDVSILGSTYKHIYSSLGVEIGITKIKLKGREDSSKLVKLISELRRNKDTILTLIWVDGANMNVSIHDLADMLADKEIIFVWRDEYYRKKVSIVFGENSITLDVDFNFHKLEDKNLVTII